MIFKAVAGRQLSFSPTLGICRNGALLLAYAYRLLVLWAGAMTTCRYFGTSH